MVRGSRLSAPRRARRRPPGAAGSLPSSAGDGSGVAASTGMLAARVVVPGGSSAARPCSSSSSNSRSSAGAVSSNGSDTPSPSSIGDGRSKPRASDMSSTLGRSERSFKPELVEELARRAVHERAADDLLAADDLHQLAIEQRVEHAGGGADASNLGDLARRDRLLVGNHRQRLERLHRQLRGRALLEQAAHPFVELRTRDDLEPARDLHQLQAVRPQVRIADLGERGLDVLASAGRRAVGRSP